MSREEFFTDPVFLEDYRRICNYIAGCFQLDPVTEGWVLPDDADVDTIEEQALRRCVDLGNAVGIGLYADYKENQSHITHETASPLTICLDLSKQLDNSCIIAGVTQRSKFFFANRIYYGHGIKACIHMMLPDELREQGIKLDVDKLIYWAGMLGDSFILTPTTDTD